MARIEVDEADLQRSETLRQTVAKMLAHPTARRKVLEAQKEIDPNTPIPELDAAKPVEDRLDKISQQFEEFRQTIASDREERDKKEKLSELNSKWESGRARLRSQGITDEGLKGVEDLMEKHGVVDHDVGLAYFEKLHPPPEPGIPSHMGRWDFFDDQGNDDFKKLIETRGESEPLTRKMANEALAEVRRR